MSPFSSRLILTLTFLAGTSSLPLQGLGDKQIETVSPTSPAIVSLAKESTISPCLVAEGDFEPPDRGKPDGTQGSGTRWRMEVPHLG